MYGLHNNQQTLLHQSPDKINIYISISNQINVSITKIGEIVTTLHHVCHVMSCHVLLQEKKEMERQLLKACKTGDLPNVKKLCRVVDASKVRDATFYDRTPLHWAALYVKHGHSYSKS